MFEIVPRLGAKRRVPFTPEQLHARAVERRDAKRALAKLMLQSGTAARDTLVVFDNRAPHANRGTPPRKHFDRSKSRETARLQYEAGVTRNALGRTADGKHDLVARYGHSAARRRTTEEAALPMAA